MSTASTRAEIDSAFSEIIRESVSEIAFRKIEQIYPDCDIDRESRLLIVNFINDSQNLTLPQKSTRVVQLIFSHQQNVINSETIDN